MDSTISKNVEATVALGREWVSTAASGGVFALVGELGAGKTHLVKGMVEGIGCSNPVTSPTFTLLHEYEGGRLPIYHFDFYRLENASAALQLGLDDYLEGDGLCVIEWADRFPEVLPERTWWILITHHEDGARSIRRTMKP